MEVFKTKSMKALSIALIAAATLTVAATDGAGNALPLRFETKIVGENDASVPKKPTRLALIVDGDVEKAAIRQTFSAQ